MKLRSHKSSQDDNPTASSTASDADAQPPPSAERSHLLSHTQSQAAAGSPTRPDLVDLVLRQMGRKDLFPNASLMALRETSSAFSVLVREVVKVLPIKVMQKYDGMQRLLESPGVVPYLEWFHYEGCNGPISDPDLETFARLLDNLPRLHKLILAPAGSALDTLSSIALPKLTCLEFYGVLRCKKGLEELGKVHEWPLQELSLHFVSGADVSDLAHAVYRFPDLRKLEISGASYARTPVDFEQLKSMSLPKLEHMTLCMSNEHFLKWVSESPWLPQLQSLSLDHSVHRHTQFNFDKLEVILATLRAGALTKLTLLDWKKNDTFLSIIDLPKLEHLELTNLMPSVSDFYAPREEWSVPLMTVLAEAALPNLRALVIDTWLTALTEGDMSALPRAFPKLQRVSFAHLCVEKSDMQTFIAEVLPQLEELDMDSSRPFLECIRELDPSVEFPMMRSLKLGVVKSHEVESAFLGRLPNLEYIEFW